MCEKLGQSQLRLARHAYGDVYKNAEIRVPGKGKAELVFTAEDGTVTKEVDS